jgi:nitrite reductase/ring-hydroxylating ferredoxin subunit
MSSQPPPFPNDVTRRGVLRGAVASLGAGAALPLLSACGGESGEGSAAAPSAPSTPVTLPSADVPVGGGAIYPDAGVVVTQPEQGAFRAFSAACTHQGCLVQSVTDGQIVCPCHASHFAITDGSVVSGPALKPLPGLPVDVSGSDLVVG